MRTTNYSVGFEVLTAVSMKIAVFWVVAPCSLVCEYIHMTAFILLAKIYFYGNTEYRHVQFRM
jgi:hypothetical protein